MSNYPRADGSETDEFEKELLDEAFLPDAAQADSHWHEVQSEYRKGTRWCRGHDLSDGVPQEFMVQLDMQSRFEARLRGKYDGSWLGSLADLERFPLNG